MSMQLAEPISVEGQSFEPRVVGQTTLFPLEDQLQRIMETTFQRGVEINRTPSNRDTVTGFIHDWTKYDSDRDFKSNAERVLSAFKSTLAPYIDGLELNELSGGFHLGPALMRYEAQHGDVKYSLLFRISDKSTYLIVSPELECTLPESSAIRQTLTGTYPNRVYERVLDYIFRRKELDREHVRNVDVKPWGYEFALKPVLVGDIRSAATELSDAAKILEDQSEVVHQAAALIAFAREGAKKVRELEEKLSGHRIVRHTRELHENKMYAEAKGLLDQVQIGETPTMNRYFV